MIGTKIKNLREQHDITAHEAAKKIGISQGYLSGVENGKPISDDRLTDFLTLGFGFDIPEAKKTIDKWRIEDRLQKGNITIQELNVSGGQVNSISGDNAVVHNTSSEAKSNLEILKLIKELKQEGVEMKDILQILKK